MNSIDASVSLDLALPNHPGNAPFSLEAISRIAVGGASASVATSGTRPLVGHEVKVAGIADLAVEELTRSGTPTGHRTAGEGVIVLDDLRPGDDAPARVVARRN